MPCRGRTCKAIRWVAGGLMLLVCTVGQAAERYAITAQHSQVQFQAYSVFAKPLGQFHAFTGEILTEAQQPGASRVRLVIEARSLDTGNAERDAHLRSKDF